MRFVDGEKWWVREDGPIKTLTDLWDGRDFPLSPPMSNSDTDIPCSTTKARASRELVPSRRIAMYYKMCSVHEGLMTRHTTEHNMQSLFEHYLAAGEELTGWPPGVSTYSWLSSDKI